MSSVGVLVLNHRNWPATLDVVRAVRAQSMAADHVIVIDNASGVDEVAAMHVAATDEGFELLILESNAGYAAGMNAGIQALMARDVDSVLLLTHDCVLQDDCLARLVEELDEHPTTGVAAPALGWKSRPGLTWSGGGELRRFTGTPHHPQKFAALDAVSRAPSRAVAWADGAALLIRREVFDEVGLLPLQYFLYFEEVDFQASVRASGYQVRIVERALGWQEPGSTPAYLAVRNQLLFLRVHQRWALPIYLSTVVYSCAREVAKVVLRRSRDLDRIRALALGMTDGISGRLRQNLVTPS